jgi:hypothetical protein
MRLESLETIVLSALEENEKARADDFILYGSVLKRLNINLNESIANVLANHITLKLPSFESVSRCRRKILETRVDLQSDKTKLTREDEQKKYKEYSRV